MLFWTIIGCFFIPLFLVVSQIRNTKKERARNLELIQRRLAEKEAGEKRVNNK